MQSKEALRSPPGTALPASTSPRAQGPALGCSAPSRPASCRPLPSAQGTLCPGPCSVATRPQETGTFQFGLVMSSLLRAFTIKPKNLACIWSQRPSPGLGEGHVRSKSKGLRGCRVLHRSPNASEQVASWWKESVAGLCLFCAAGQEGSRRDMLVDSEGSQMARSVQTQDSWQRRMGWNPQTYRSRLRGRLWRAVQLRASVKPVPPS